MNNNTKINILYRAKHLTRISAKAFAWIFGVQLALLYILANVAEAPLTELATPGLRFAVALSIVFFNNRIYEALLRRMRPAKAV